MPSTPTAEPTASSAGESGAADRADEHLAGRLRRGLRSTRVEIGLAAALVVLSSAYLIQFLHTMAHAPLWNDELWSVLNFSSRGPHRSLTTVNDSILPNVINSVLPGSSSLDPLRERLISMLAVVATPVVGLVAFVRRRWYLPGALLFFVFTVNFNWLDEVLQDRGYGVLGLCAMVASLCLWRFLEDDRRRWLWGLALVSVAGMWTVPSFAFFVVPAWLLLLATRRRRQVAGFAAATGVVTALVYAPVLGSLWHQFTTYSDSFGHAYGSPAAPLRTFWDYLFDRGGDPLQVAVWLLAALAPLLVLLPARPRLPQDLEPLARDLAVDAPSALRATVRVLCGASAGVIVIALVLSTPPQRTVAYLVVPVTVATAASLAILASDPRKGTAIRAFTVVAAVLACLHGAFAIPDFSYTPIENWSGAAAYIQRTFPDHVTVSAVARGQYLSPYLDARHPSARLEASQLRAGTQVVDLFDPAHGVGAEQRRLAARDPDLVEVDLPQRRGVDPPDAFPLLFVPPAQSRVSSVTVDGSPAPALLDASLATEVRVGTDGRRTPVAVSARLVPGTVARSLVLVLARGTHPGRVQATITDPSGRTTVLATSALTLSPGVITVHLGDRHLARVTLSITGGGSPLVLRELWVYGP